MLNRHHFRSLSRWCLDLVRPLNAVILLSPRSLIHASAVSNSHEVCTFPLVQLPPTQMYREIFPLFSHLCSIPSALTSDPLLLLLLSRNSRICPSGVLRYISNATDWPNFHDSFLAIEINQNHITFTLKVTM